MNPWAYFRNHLAHEEVPEVQGEVLVGVGDLLFGDLDVQADAGAARVGRTFVGGLHDAAAAARDDGKAGLGELAGSDFREPVVRVRGGGPGRAEDRDGRTDRGQLLEAFRELRHDAEDPPEVSYGVFQAFQHVISSGTHHFSIDD